MHNNNNIDDRPTLSGQHMFHEHRPTAHDRRQSQTENGEYGHGATV